MLPCALLFQLIYFNLFHSSYYLSTFIFSSISLVETCGRILPVQCYLWFEIQRSERHVFSLLVLSSLHFGLCLIERESGLAQPDSMVFCTL